MKAKKKTFSAKMRDFIVCRPALQEILNEVLLTFLLPYYYCTGGIQQNL
jgi:hypothetical protein